MIWCWDGESGDATIFDALRVEVPCTLFESYRAPLKAKSVIRRERQTLTDDAEWFSKWCDVQRGSALLGTNVHLNAIFVRQEHGGYSNKASSAIVSTFYSIPFLANNK